MQQIETHIRAQSTSGIMVDPFNTSTSRKISILRGMQAELVIQMFKSSDSSDDAAKYSADDFEDFVSWKMYADVDYNQGTSLKLLVDSDDISVGIDGRIHIVFRSTNTETLAAAIGEKASIELICELLGYAEGISTPSFALQFPLTILNRVGIEGATTPIPASGLVGALAELFSDFTSLSDDPSIDEIVEKLSTLITKIKGE